MHRPGRGRLRLALALLACAAAARWPAGAGADALDEKTLPQQDVTESVDSTCRLESFFVVEANVLARKGGLPVCQPEQLLAVSTASGRVFLRDSAEAKAHGATASHFFGTHAAPWFLYQAIMDSPFHTRNQEEAGLFYVNDYCFWLWWLAAAQSNAPESPGDALLQVYKELLESATWKRRRGRDFVFFIPYSLQLVAGYEAARPGGGVLKELQELVCTQLRPALQLTVEQTQGWEMCRHSRKKASLVVPFVPNVADAKGAALMESLSHMSERALQPRSQRPRLAYFRGHCGGPHARSPARLLRAAVVAAFAGADERFDVKCLDREKEGRLPFERQLQAMEQSAFCLVLPELGQSARVLSEAMLAGCIPVFVGPPFAATPFVDDLDYTAFALFVELEDRAWLTAGGPEAGASSEAVETALLTKEGLELDTGLPDVSGLPEYLANVPEEAIVEGLAEVSKVRHRFVFYPELDAEKPSAVDLLMLNLCRHMNHLANSLPGIVPKRLARRLLDPGP